MQYFYLTYIYLKCHNGNTHFLYSLVEQIFSLWQLSTKHWSLCFKKEIIRKQKLCHLLIGSTQQVYSHSIAKLLPDWDRGTETVGIWNLETHMKAQFYPSQYRSSVLSHLKIYCQNINFPYFLGKYFKLLTSFNATLLHVSFIAFSLL